MPTRSQYRQQFARDMGAYGPGFPQGASSATSTPSNTLIDATWPILSAIAKNNLYEGWWLLRPEAAAAGDRVRQIIPGGYDPSTGTFTLDANYSTPVTSGSKYELHGHDFEPWYEVGDLMNEALKLIYIPVQIPYRPNPWTATGENTQLVVNFTRSNGGQTGSSVHRTISQLLHAGHILRLDLCEPGATGIVNVITAGGSSGSYTLSYNGYTTGSLFYSDSGPAVQAALRLLPGLEGVEVAFAGSSGNYNFQITLYGVPLGSPWLTYTQGTFNGTITISLNNPLGKLDPMKARLFMNGTDVLAELDRGFSTNNAEHIYVTCLVRAYDWCRTASTTAWGERSGLSVDTDLAMPVEEFVSVGMQLVGWKRSPRVMEEATEHRRVLNLTDCQQEFNAYQAAYLKSATRSPLLKYDVDGGMLELKLPFSLGGAIPGPAARALANAPAFETPAPQP